MTVQADNFIGDMREVHPSLEAWAVEQLEGGATVGELRDRLEAAFTYVCREKEEEGTN